MSASLKAAKNRITGKRSNRNFMRAADFTSVGVRIGASARHEAAGPGHIGVMIASGGMFMSSLVRLVEYAEASPEVRAVYDKIMTARGTDWINNFWKALANDPALLGRVWASVQQVMAPGALDPLTKEMVYLAVSATNNCEYCSYSHTAAARRKGMTDAMLMELMAVVGLANENNRLANGLRIPVDEQFKVQP